MKHFSKLLIPALMLGMMACSEKEIPGAEDINPGVSQGETYAKLTLSLPTTRSTTTTDGNTSNGVEYGQDYENYVKTVIVVLAEKASENTYKFITSSISDSEAADSEIKHEGIGDHPMALPTYKLQFETQKLLPYASTEEKQNTVYLFAFANPTKEIKEYIEGVEASVNPASGTPVENTEWIDKVFEAENPAQIWASNSFLMTNKFITKSNVLPTVDDMHSKYNKVTYPFDLGVIDVQRAAARFDYQQRGTYKEGDEYVANHYNVVNRINNKVVGAVALDGMAMINVANNFYYLPRVSTNGAATAAELCGSETSSNYVVSPIYDKIQALTDADSYKALAKYYAAQWFLPTLTNYDDLTYTSFSSLTKDDNDEYWDYDVAKEGETESAYDKTGYKIWRYATENTIPADVEGKPSQRKGITTGVVFQAHLLPKAVVTGNTESDADADNALLEAMVAKKELYLFNGVLYAGVEAIVAEVTEHPNSQLAFAFEKSFEAKTTGEGDDAVTTYTYDSTVGNAQGFTEYTPSNDMVKDEDGKDLYPKYYLYYTYYNRHNDNGNPSLMGQMEFGVVRNNVYKLSVNIIYSFGTPGNRPDNPDDPDEDPETYFSVRLHVLPWVVRINNIEF